MHTGRMGLNIFSPVIITILNCSEREDHHWLICVYCNQRETRQQQQQKTQMEKAIFFPGRASFLKIKKKKLSFCCVIDMIMTKVSKKNKKITTTGENFLYFSPHPFWIYKQPVEFCSLFFLLLFTFVSWWLCLMTCLVSVFTPVKIVLITITNQQTLLRHCITTSSGST